jgi:hypothetical protein
VSGYLPSVLILLHSSVGRKRATCQAIVVPAAIPPVPFLSGGRFGTGGGGEPGNQRTDVHRVDSFWSSPKFCSPSMLVVELKLPAAVILLRRQIRLVCLLLFFSGDGKDGIHAAVAGFLNFSVIEAGSPFCLLLFVRGGISGTSGAFQVVDGGSHGLLFRSSALRATAVDVLFLFLLRGEVGGWSFNVYDSSCRVGKAMALAAHPMFARRRDMEVGYVRRMAVGDGGPELRQ